jgi:hypothetical protein
LSPAFTGKPHRRSQPVQQRQHARRRMCVLESGEALDYQFAAMLDDPREA